MCAKEVNRYVNRRNEGNIQAQCHKTQYMDFDQSSENCYNASFSRCQYSVAFFFMFLSRKIIYIFQTQKAFMERVKLTAIGFSR